MFFAEVIDGQQGHPRHCVMCRQRREGGYFSREFFSNFFREFFSIFFPYCFCFVFFLLWLLLRVLSKH